MSNKLKCTKCNEMREVSQFGNTSSNARGKKYQCKFCTNKASTVRRYKDEPFKRNPSPCDSRLADKELAKEIREIWEME